MPAEPITNEAGLRDYVVRPDGDVRPLRIFVAGVIVGVLLAISIGGALR